MQTLNKVLNQYWLDFRKQNFSTRTIILSSVLIGSLIRLLGLFNIGFYFDMIETQYTWGSEAWDNGLFEFWRDYPMEKHYDYPQISLIYEYILGGISSFFDSRPQVFVLLVKLVNWFFDLIFVGLVFWLGKKFSSLNDKLIYLFTSFAYISPSIWFVSAIWGQNDTFVVLITILTMAILLWRNNKIVTETYDIFGEQKKYDEHIEHEKKYLDIPWLNDKAFWSGLVFAFGFWVKQQPILVLPLLAIYFLYKKSWEDIIRIFSWILPFLIFAGFLGSLYSNEMILYQNPLSFLPGIAGIVESLGFSQISNWGIIVNFGTIWLIAIYLITIWKINQKGPWRELRLWFFGFMSLTMLVSIPAIILNYQRFARVTFATAIRGDAISNGAATFWGLFKNLGSSNDLVFYLGNTGLNVSQSGLLIYIILFSTILWFYFGLSWSKVLSLQLNEIINKPLNFADFLNLMWVNTVIYFLFFTNMHSRYLHFGILYSFLILVSYGLTIKKYFKIFFVLFIFLNFSYFLNQALVFGVNNESLNWVIIFINWFSDKGRNLNAQWWASLINSISIFGIYIILLLHYKNKHRVKVILSDNG